MTRCLHLALPALLVLGLLAQLSSLAYGSGPANTMMVAADQTAPQKPCECGTEALKLYLLGAEQGNPGAQYNLALMYENGKGVPRNFAEAIRWYRVAAEQGHGGAQYNLGRLYAGGEGVTQDLVQAYLWLDLAARQGPPGYKATLERAALAMTTEQIMEAQRLADEWLAQHSN